MIASGGPNTLRRVSVIVVGVVGLLGVVVGGILQIEASRRALLRKEQLDAATDMHIAGTAFFTAMERRSRTLGLDDVRKLTPDEKLAWLTASRETVDAAREDARRLMEVLARVVLVFGHHSKPGSAAAETVANAHTVIEVLAQEGEDRAEALTAAWAATVKSLERFSVAAHDDFTRPLWRR